TADQRRSAGRLGPAVVRRPSSIVRSYLPEPHHALGSARREAIEVGVDGIEILAQRLRAAWPHHDDGLGDRPVPARRLTENEDWIRPLRSHQSIHHFDRYRAKRRKRRDRFLVLALLRAVDENGRVELAVLA